MSAAGLCDRRHYFAKGLGHAQISGRCNPSAGTLWKVLAPVAVYHITRACPEIFIVWPCFTLRVYKVHRTPHLGAGDGWE